MSNYILDLNLCLFILIQVFLRFLDISYALLHHHQHEVSHGDAECSLDMRCLLISSVLSHCRRLTGGLSSLSESV